MRPPGYGGSRGMWSRRQVIASVSGSTRASRRALRRVNNKKRAQARLTRQTYEYRPGQPHRRTRTALREAAEQSGQPWLSLHLDRVELLSRAVAAFLPALVPGGLAQAVGSGSGRRKILFRI